MTTSSIELKYHPAIVRPAILTGINRMVALAPDSNMQDEYYD